MKDRRLYAKFTLDFADNYKILPLSDEAFRCLVEATLWSRKHMTDGVLARRYAVARWGLGVMTELATNDPENPSLIESEEGWLIRDFAEHQDTRAEIEARSERNKAAGQKGGQARAKRSAKRVASASVSETQAETETETYKNKGDFEAFWTAYPRKVSRKAAEKAYTKALADVTAEQLLTAAKAYAHSVKDSDPKFIAHPTTWLNQGRWDEFETAPSVDPDQFLRDCWERGSFGPITTLTGYPCPLPEFRGEGEPGFDKETARRDFYRGFIADKHDELLMRVREAM